MFFRESNPSRFRPNFGIYGTGGGFYPDGFFVYCAFSNTQLATFRPDDFVNGTFTYCAFDLNNSGFDRTP